MIQFLFIPQKYKFFTYINQFCQTNQENQEDCRKGPKLHQLLIALACEICSAQLRIEGFFCFVFF